MTTFSYPTIFYGKGAKQTAYNDLSNIFGIKNIEHHVDIKIFKGDCTIDLVRWFIEDVRTSPSVGDKKAYLFLNVEMLTLHWNAMLKILEEFPDFVVVYYVVENLSVVPKTILSRCQKVYCSKSDLVENKKLVLQCIECANNRDYRSFFDLLDKLLHVEKDVANSINYTLEQAISLDRLKYFRKALSVNFDKTQLLEYLLVSFLI